MKEPKTLAILTFSSPKAWDRWLTANHQQSDAIWMKLAKKDSGISSVTYGEALEVALCHGWIDGQKKALDAQYWLQWFGARRPRSQWSKINCDKAKQLIALGRMKPAGLNQVELAKADGRWDVAYASPSNATVPEDFQCELDANPAAKSFFSTLNRVNRYAILYRIQSAKRPETRVRRIAQFIQMLVDRKTIH